MRGCSTMRFIAVSAAKNFSLCRIIGSNNGSGITTGHVLF